MKKCADCGNAPVNHRMEWLSAVFEKKLIPSGTPSSDLWSGVRSRISEPFQRIGIPFIMNTLVAAKLSRYADAPDARTNGRSQVMWEEANRRGIRVREFRLFGIGRDVFIATYGGETKIFLDLPRPGTTASSGLGWMGHKEILRQRLSAKGIPTPRGGVATSVAGAKELFERLRHPVITKPETGSRSRHTTTHIHTEEELISAFKKAALLSPWVIVEEELLGFVHRGTVIGGKLVAVLRREPPMVIGDGKHTIAELVAIENENTRRDEKIFHGLEVNEDAQAELLRQGLSLESIPKMGDVITLSQKASRGIGGGATDMTDDIHLDNREMLEAAAGIVDDPLMGFDFIIDDVTRSWKEQERSGIIECNSMPFIDLHHFPLVGSPRNVAGNLWDVVFPDSSRPVS